MSNLAFDTFCARVCSAIRWKPARKLARAELTAHLEDHAQALAAQGLAPGLAAERAVAAMGDPYELGHALDRAHPPTLPRLSRALLALGLLILTAALVLGSRQGTGLPALSGITPRSPELPESPTVETVLCEGAVSGGGQLGPYTFTPSGQAALTSRVWPEPDGTETIVRTVQIPLTISPRRFWLPAPRLPAQEEGVYTDGAGRAGEGCISTCDTYLLGASGFLTLYSPAPGAREFSVTVSLFGEELRFTVTLEQEVPPL